MTIKHRTIRGKSRKFKGGNPFQGNMGAPYDGAYGSGMRPTIASLTANGGRRTTRDIRHYRRTGGNPFQGTMGAPYSGTDSGNNNMPTTRALGASGGEGHRHSRKVKGGNPFQGNVGAPYDGADSGSDMGPTTRALGASGGRRHRHKKSRRGKGGSILAASAVPFGLLGLQEWFKGAFKEKK